MGRPKKKEVEIDYMKPHQFRAFAEEEELNNFTQPAELYDNDYDIKRDDEVKVAVSRLQVQAEIKDIKPIVDAVVEIIHSDSRMQNIIAMPHYRKLIREITLAIIFRKHFEDVYDYTNF